MRHGVQRSRPDLSRSCRQSRPHVLNLTFPASTVFGTERFSRQVLSCAKEPNAQSLRGAVP